MTEGRNERLDGIKYLLICLVVLCHLMQGVRYENSVFQCIYSVVYAFHMPLFVLLSGYFFHYATAKEVHRSNMKLIEPMVVWYLLPMVFYNTVVRHQLSIFPYLYFEPTPLWYLVSLVCWRWMMLGLNKVITLPAWGGGKN